MIKNIIKIVIILVVLTLQSCGTFHWVEPIGPAHANNHRFSR